MALQGFIITKLDENENPIQYWDGTAFVDAIDSADFIETKTEARYVQGSTQSQDTANDIAIKDAETSVKILP